MKNLLPLSVGYTVAILWLAAQHTVYALAVQICVGLASGNWWAGGLAACAYWAGREVAQAEARFIAGFVTSGHRADMPRWAFLDPRAWNTDSLLWDLAAPCVVCYALFALSVVLRF